MPLDPTKHPDWQIAEAAEANMKTAYQLADELGLENRELLPLLHNKKPTSSDTGSLSSAASPTWSLNQSNPPLSPAREFASPQ